MPRYALNVNGQPCGIDAPADTPLLWVLRDHLRLTGTKFGCGVGACGACTVHLDGVAARSCQTPISALAQVAITTIEGLDPAGNHPLQRAWCEHDVAQCGYCQAGQVMCAAALLKTRPSPTDEEISQALAGNLCRCGTYHRIRDAIKSAAETMKTSASS
jgi:isoquinoline 1-oxidoreductase alpha subunit